MGLGGPQGWYRHGGYEKNIPPYPSGHFNLAGKFKKSIQITYIYF